MIQAHVAVVVMYNGFLRSKLLKCSSSSRHTDTPSIHPSIHPSMHSKHALKINTRISKPEFAVIIVVVVVVVDEVVVAEEIGCNT
jgi:hypothetical protein